MQKEEDSFRFTYSAKEQEELIKIRQKYEPQEETKMDKLRRLDAGVTKKATKISLLLGIIGALVLGIGMSFTMTDFGEMFGLMGNQSMAIGVFVGILGMILLGMACPVYYYIVKKEREKIAPEILRLTEELMK